MSTLYRKIGVPIVGGVVCLLVGVWISNLFYIAAAAFFFLAAERYLVFRLARRWRAGRLESASS